MIEKKKFNFHFDFGEERNEQLLNDKNEQTKFNNKLKQKLSMEYNIPEEKNNSYKSSKRKLSSTSNI